MSRSEPCFNKEISLNELLHDPIIAMLMRRDGVHSDDIRALFRDMAERDDRSATPRPFEISYPR